MGTDTHTTPQPSKFSAILHCKCPKCRQGKLFPHPITSISKFGKMNQECDVCGQDFRIEPGFYFGASYISYAINVVFIIAFVAAYFIWFSEQSPWYLVGIILFVSVLLTPPNYRYSRTLMLHWFGGVRS